MNKKEYHDYKSLEKIYKELLEEYKYVKNKYNTLKDKEKMYQDKYKGIIKLLNEAFEDLIKDEEIVKRKNIYINVNDLNKGSYEKYTKKEKYYILVFIINHLLPLIHINENENKLSSLKDKINNIEFKMNKTQMAKFSDSSRCQTIRKPLLGMTSNNFFNISTNNESVMNSERQNFVSIFGDDYIQYGKKILTEKGQSIKKGKINFDKILKKKNKIKNSNNDDFNKIIKNFSNFGKTKNFFNNNKNYQIESFTNNIENSRDKKIYKRKNTFDRKLVRIMIV